jgi:hypothetical protein
MRFLRVGSGLLAAVTLRWVAAGVAALAVAAAAAAVVVILANQDDGGGPATPAGSPSPPATVTPAASPSAPSTPSPAPTPGARHTPFPSVDSLGHVSLAPGDTITGGYGLLFGNPATGGVEAWLLPENGHPAGVSPQGRYFVFGTELIDAWTGTRTALPLAGEAVEATFAPDDSAVVVQSATEAVLVANDGSLVLEFPGFSARAPGEAMWSRDSRAVALTSGGVPNGRVDVVVDGTLRPEIPSTGPTAWSHEGLRLAVTGERPAVYDYGSGGLLALARGGTFPSWSPDDAYIAVDISAAAGLEALSALDATTGQEVIRIYNRSACLVLSWVPGPALPGDDAGPVHVPSGDRVPFPDQPAPIGFPNITMPFGRAGPVPPMQWQDASGHVYAEVYVDAIWAYTFDWTRRDIDAGFPPVLFLGRGGQDACIGARPPVVIAKPPFTPAQVPTPTPTPDK